MKKGRKEEKKVCTLRDFGQRLAQGAGWDEERVA